MRRDRPIRQLDLRSRFGAFLAGEGHAHRFDFPISGPIAAASRNAASEIEPLRPPIFNGKGERAWISEATAARTGQTSGKDHPKKAMLRARSW
jgi:hypothetical protein